MPAINMPQRTEAPIVPLMGIIKGISDISRNSAESSALDEKTKGEQLANTQAAAANANSQAGLVLAQQQQKDLQDPKTDASMGARAQGAGVLSQIAKYQNPDFGKNPDDDAKTPMGALIAKASDPNTPGYYVNQLISSPTVQENLGLMKAKMSADAMALKAQSMAGPREEAVEFNKHKTAVDSVQNDHATGQIVSQYNNLNNALTNFKNSGGMPQEFMQLQNSLRQNANQGGSQSGVSERAEGYAHDLGINKDQAMQIITGNVQNVNMSSPDLVKAMQHIAQGELGNKQTQGAQMINKKANAFSSVYNKPTMQGYKQDFTNTVANQYSQLDLDQNGKPINKQDDTNSSNYVPSAQEAAAELQRRRAQK